VRTIPHIVAGAVVAALPDAALLLVIRRAWLPRDHWVIRLHAWLHQSPWGFVLAAVLGWASHLVADRYTTHNVAPGVRAVRGWTW
jgi:hypothetical protein